MHLISINLNDKVLILQPDSTVNAWMGYIANGREDYGDRS